MCQGTVVAQQGHRRSHPLLAPQGVFKPSVNLPTATQAAADPAYSKNTLEDMAAGHQTCWTESSPSAEDHVINM